MTIFFVFTVDCVFKIFGIGILYSDADVRLARRIRLDTADKGRDIGTVLDQVRENLYIYIFFLLPIYSGYPIKKEKKGTLLCCLMSKFTPWLIHTGQMWRVLKGCFNWSICTH